MIVVGFLQIQLRTGNLISDAAINELQVAEQMHFHGNPGIGNTATTAESQYAPGRGSHHRRGRGHGHGRGRGGRFGDEEDMKVDTYDKRCCFHCGLPGHIKDDSPHIKRALRIDSPCPSPPAKRQNTGNAAVAIGDFDNDDDAL